MLKVKIKKIKKKMEIIKLNKIPKKYIKNIIGIITHFLSFKA